ncbi:MAG: ABC transporter ATP-binding protein [Chloroflexi bacterium]|nr:ABC transporter ATP-binding protein [Chloroflexota bacterium]
MINCDNLVKIYKIAELEVVALQGLDLTVERGEMVGIVGASGSGKTTLLNILGGLDRPSAGRVTVDGQDLLKLSDAALNRYRRKKVGFVWQQTSRNLIPYLTAQENVKLPMTVAGMSRREKRAWARELLQAVGLYQRRKHRLVQLSGGEQQRVAIAAALANKPILLLADEPTGEVDSATAQTILETFQRLNETLGLTTIIVTHEPGIVGQVDRVVAIRDGRTSTETIRQVSQLEQAMVGEHPVEEEDVTYHEYVVLDSAGRLQVPREYLEQLDIGDRATLEVTEEGILIRPVAGRQAAAAPLLPGLEEEELPAPRRRGLRGLWARVRRGR